MERSATPPDTADIRRTGLRDDWPLSALMGGFIATFCLTVIVATAYTVASTLGKQSGTTLQGWLYGLAHNATTSRTGDAIFLAIALNLAIGLALAIVYAWLVEPCLSGPGYWRGMIFALIPMLISLFIVFPLMGVGVLGASAGSGPLAALGSVVAHLVYGFVLGGFYSFRLEDWEGSSPDDQAAARSANRGSARGVLIGMPIGAVVGLIVAPMLDSVAGEVAIVLGHILLGGAFGLLIGSLSAMQVITDEEEARQPTSPSTERPTAPMPSRLVTPATADRSQP